MVEALEMEGTCENTHGAQLFDDFALLRGVGFVLTGVVLVGVLVLGLLWRDKLHLDEDFLSQVLQ